MIDLTSARKRFRDRILADAEARMAAELGGMTSLRVVNVNLPVGVRGIVLQGGESNGCRLSLNGTATVMSWSLAAKVSGIWAVGSVTVDVLNGRTLATRSSICGGVPPALAAQPELTEQTPIGWTTSLADPSWIEAFVTSVDGVLEEAILTLRCSVGIDPTVQTVIDTTSVPVTDNAGNVVTW